MKKKISIVAILLLGSLVAPCVGSVQGWSNGGFSTDPSYPDYGTHDWIAQHALDWLPTQEKQYIIDNLAAYLYGTELPDNNNAAVPGHIGDTTKHHVYFWANGSLQDDVAADRATEEYQTALNLLGVGNFSGAALTAGIMSHYIADVAVFAHVMGASTAWGAETGNVHSNYESYVETRTNAYSDTYNSYLLFDGALSTISAYDAAKNLAFDTTFDGDGTYNCVWMNSNYDISNPNSPFWIRAGESLNLAVNAVTDTLHTLFVSSIIQPSPTPTVAPIPTPTPSPSPTPTTSPSSSPSPSPAPTDTPTPTPTLTAAPTQTPPPTTSPTRSPSTIPTATIKPTQKPTANPTSSQIPASPTIPEVPHWAFVVALVLGFATVVALVFKKISHVRTNPAKIKSILQGVVFYRLPTFWLVWKEWLKIENPKPFTG
jgi:hypothetical protein